MTLSKSREYLSTRQKPKGVFRIVALGDSMTYGHGVGISETLPAQLERLLNRSAWDSHVEVVNCGQDGLSLFDLWAILGTRARYYDPDLIILILCDNDALMGNEPGDGYYARVSYSWQANRTYLAETFCRIKQEGTELGIPIEIAFYYQRDNALRRSCLEVITELCRQNGLGFCDLSAEFEKGIAESDWQIYRASAVDPHPSPFAHNLAARALARRLFRAGYFSAKASNSETVLIEQAVSQSVERVRSGVPLAWAASRLSAHLDDKQHCRNRAMLSTDQRLHGRDRRQLQVEADDLASLAARVLAWQAVLRCLNDRLQALSEHVRWLDRHLMELRVDALCSTTQVLAADCDGVAPMLRAIQHLLDLIANALQCLTSCPGSMRGWFAPLVQLIQQDRAAVRAELQRGWQDLFEILQGYRNILEERRRIPNPESLSEIGKHIDMCEWAACLRETRRLVLQNASLPHHDLLFLAAVRSLDDSDEESPITLSIWSSLPPVAITDEQHLIRDRASHAYRFELPILAFAIFTIAFSAKTAVLESVEVRGSDAAGRVLQAEELEQIEPGVYRVPPFPIAF